MKYIFGPVLSRRLGLSLGVDLVPFKVCSFDCVYCECGRTTLKTMERKEYVPAKEVLIELKAFLEKDIYVDFITFSGFGEPTLNIKFGDIASEIKKISGNKLALITNASLFNLKDVRKEASLCDVVLPSLDTAINETFRRINRPCEGINVEDLIQGLKSFRDEYSETKMALEILFVRGFNDSEKELEALKEAVEYIDPHEVHLNTVVRPPAEDVYGVSEEFLKYALKVLGEKARIVGVSHLKERNCEALFQAIIEAIKRRPMTIGEIADLLGEDERIVGKYLIDLEVLGKVQKINHSGKIYYRGKNHEEDNSHFNADVSSNCSCPSKKEGYNGGGSCQF